MPPYNIRLAAQAKKTLEKIALRQFLLCQRILSALEDIQKDPFQGKTLGGELKGRYSYRVGDYRILYRIYQRELLIYVIDMGHRRDIYR